MSRSVSPSAARSTYGRGVYRNGTRERMPSPKGPRKTSDSSQVSPRKRNSNQTLSRIPSVQSSSSSSGSSSPDRRPVRRRPALRQRYSEDYSARSTSPPRGRKPPAHQLHGDPEDEKPWFRRKTLWATIASIASVASVMAVSLPVDSPTGSTVTQIPKRKSCRESCLVRYAIADDASSPHQRRDSRLKPLANLPMQRDRVPMPRIVWQILPRSKPRLQ